MPQLGETVTEGTIIRWLKKVGEPVAQDEPLFEVSTDKVDSEVPSSVDGYLTEILVDEGETVDVGTRLAVIGEEAGSEGAAAGTPAVEQAAPLEPAKPAEPTEPAPAAGAPATAEAANEEPPPEAAVDSVPAPVGTGARTPDTGAAPANAQPARTVPGGNGRASQPQAGGAGGGGALLLSPVVRKLINEHDLDPSQIPGTGQGGRITRGDVLTYLDQRAASGGTAASPASQAQVGAPTSTSTGRPAPAPGSGASAAPPAAVAARAFPPSAPGERDEVVPFTNIRRLTAEHMVRSKATSAHTLVAVEADYEAIEKVRREYRDRFKEEEGISLTYLPFVARALVDALRDFPHMNASVGEDSLVIHRDVHLGIAVDLDRQGLIVPVVRNADGQSLRGLARAMADLAARARTRRISPDDVVGGTFTVTNPGPFGTFLTAPIISQPQVAILSTDGVKRRPVVVSGPDGSEAIAIHSVGMLGLSFDHRAVDGAYASAFLRALADEIAMRDWSAEL